MLDLFDPSNEAFAGDDDRNPYLGKSGKWYFYDPKEEAHGPYDTEELAEAALDVFLKG